MGDVYIPKRELEEFVRDAGRRSTWIIFKVEEVWRHEDEADIRVVIEEEGSPKDTFEDMKKRIDPDSARHILLYTPYEVNGHEKGKVILVTYVGPKSRQRKLYDYPQSRMYRALGDDACELELSSYDDLDLKKIVAAVTRKEG